MIDLQPVCGLPVALDPDTFALTSTDPSFELPEPGLRSADEMRPLLLDPEADLPDPLYWMYRDLALPGQEHLRRDLGLRYDISVFRGEPMGREVFKTAGHYHPYIQARHPLTYPEVYEVLYGEAIYLLQYVDDIYRDPYYVQVRDFIVVHARAGQKIIVPPNYGHVTLNPNPDQPMVMSNWVCDWFKSTYDAVVQARGFAYYCLVAEESGHEWIPNPTYRQPLPPLRRARTLSVPELGLVEGEPMYQACVEDPAKFEFVCRPQEYLAEIWSSLEFIG